MFCGMSEYNFLFRHIDCYDKRPVALKSLFRFTMFVACRNITFYSGTLIVTINVRLLSSHNSDSRFRFPLDRFVVSFFVSSAGVAWPERRSEPKETRKADTQLTELYAKCVLQHRL